MPMDMLTLRYRMGRFTLSGSNLGFQKFETRREAWNWCAEQHPGMPIKDFGAAAAKRAKARNARAVADALSNRPFSIIPAS